MVVENLNNNTSTINRETLNEMKSNINHIMDILNCLKTNETTTRYLSINNHNDIEKLQNIINTIQLNTTDLKYYIFQRQKIFNFLIILILLNIFILTIIIYLF